MQFNPRSNFLLFCKKYPGISAIGNRCIHEKTVDYQYREENWEGKSPAQILEVIMGGTSRIALMRYKTSDAIWPVIRELVSVQALGSQAGQSSVQCNKEAVPAGRRVLSPTRKAERNGGCIYDWPRYLYHTESLTVTSFHKKNRTWLI